MPQSFGALYTHLVFSTKGREPWVLPTIADRLHEYIGGTLRAHKCVLLDAGGMPDHLHLLISMSREMSASELARVVKANSTRWIHATYANMAYFAWQAGYGAFSVSFSKIGHVKDYIAKQEAHHRKKSFQDEFREYLRAHELEWDERYVWD